MLITVVNRSEYTDEYVQEVIRAVNRQLAEDFARYWNRSGELRLEGAVGDRPDARKAEELRGDAILYLWDQVDQAGALGYHDLNHRGIPFGVVFTQLSDQLEEDWSVTFSHEALELVIDPEANLLVEGPHPEDPERTVFHWYEVCDAVQAETYEIDAVAVSNFVLPLYFTQSEERGSRNDFLGNWEHPLPSFGVAAGGYVGFFDPVSGRHDQYESPEGDSRARQRARTAAGYTRRTVRRKVERNPESVIRQILGRSPSDDLPAPVFEGFAVDVRATRGADPFAVLSRAANAALGRGWQGRFDAWEPERDLAPAGVTWYELTPRGAPPAVAEAWDAAYALRAQPGVADVEPEFRVFAPDSEMIRDLPTRARAMTLFGDAHLPGSNDPDWSIEQIRADEAWQLSRGAGIAVGHPDTGFLEHPDIFFANGPLDTTRDYDFVDGDADAHAGDDDINIGGPNHGTATASVIVAATGITQPPLPPCDGDENTGGPVWVSGVAPDATLVPLRVADGVIHLSWSNLRLAVQHAMDEGLHVLSMSLGGPFPSRRTRKLIQRATDAGVILIAAAGNDIPFHPVVWPARYPEVVACAACNAARAEWKGSSRGDAIDITAPGESVWRAFVDIDPVAAERYRVGRSSGTSYATAHVAGACALWLSHHGRDALVGRYGDRLTDAFRYALAHCASGDHDLPSGGFGPGLLDSRALLDLALPTRAEVVAWADGDAGLRARRRAAGSGAPAPLAALRDLFPGLADRELNRGLSALLDTPVTDLAAAMRDVGDEIVFQLAAHPTLRRRFHARCREVERMSGRRAAMGPLTCAALDDVARGLRRSGSAVLRARLRAER